MCRETRFWSKTHSIMCHSAHNYPTFGSSGHIITRVLDQSTLENLQRKPRTFFSHIITSGLDWFWEASYSAWKVQRICIWPTDSLTKSGKSTDSLMFLGKIHRFFAEIRREETRQIVQTWRTSQAAAKSSKLDALFRLQRNRPSLTHFSGCRKKHTGFLAKQKRGQTEVWPLQ